MSYLAHDFTPHSTIRFSLGTLPAHLSATHAPTKKSPWRTIREVEFINSAVVLLPDELYEMIWPAVLNSLPTFQYAKVVMKLEEVLEGDFFNHYIKKGNVLMLSDGHHGEEDVFCLREGTLYLELSATNYERAGLSGKAVRSGARKHVKSRFLVEIDLRSPSMLHGKKGFERLIWAAKNVLNQGRNWVFMDLNALDTPQDATMPIHRFHPTVHGLVASSELSKNVSVPRSLITASSILDCDPGDPAPSEEAQESIYDMFEYLDMLHLQSPRVQGADVVDPFISRYTVPDLSEYTGAETQNVRLLKWMGLIPIPWILAVFGAVITQSRAIGLQSLSQQCHWLAFSAIAQKAVSMVPKEGYTILLQAASDTPKTKPTVIDRASDGVHGLAADESPEQTAPVDPEATVSQSSAAKIGTQNGSTAPAAHPGAGFQRYVCAEYVNTLHNS